MSVEKSCSNVRCRSNDKKYDNGCGAYEAEGFLKCSMIQTLTPAQLVAEELLKHLKKQHEFNIINLCGDRIKHVVEDDCCVCQLIAKAQGKE